VRTLYYVPGSAAMAAHAAIEEASLEYRLVEVVRLPDRNEPEAFRRASPHGRVPVFVDGGETVWESAAVVLHVADRYPQSRLAPPLGTPERTVFYRWLMYLTNTLQPDLMRWYYPERFVLDPAAAPSVKGRAADITAGIYDWIDGELADRPYLLGETFSGADLYLHMLTRWGRFHSPPAWERPRLRAHYGRVGARPSVRSMMEWQGLEE
jgi:glutathione S-transferase